MILNNWIIVSTTDVLNNKVDNYLSFNKIDFKTHNSVDIYTNMIFDGNRVLERDYKISNDTLTIEMGSFPYTFVIDSLSSNYLVLQRGLFKYSFKKYIPRDDASILIDNDTVRLESIIRPSFKGNYYKYLYNSKVQNTNNEPSLNIDIEFYVMKDGSVKKISIESEENEIVEKLDSIILNTNGKWKPGKLDGVKEDIIISHKMLILNKGLKFFDIKNPVKRSEKLYEKGIEYYEMNQLDSALIYFSECITLFCYIKSLQPYLNEFINLQMYWVNSTMNRAVIYFNRGNKPMACSELEKIITYDYEAGNTYFKYCTEE